MEQYGAIYLDELLCCLSLPSDIVHWRWWDYERILITRKADVCYFVYTVSVDNAWAVGNKDDNDRKVVQPSDARRLAEQVGIPFYETSAKENKNVEEVGVLKSWLTSN